MKTIKQNQIKELFRLNKLAEEFAIIGIKIQSPKISNDQIRAKVVERWNLNNIQEQCERKMLLKKS